MEKAGEFSAQERTLFTTDNGPEVSVELGTVEDREAMQRLGKDQLFKVFDPIRASYVC